MKRFDEDAPAERKSITVPAGAIERRNLGGDPGDSNYDLHRRKILRAHAVAESEYAVKIIGTSPFRFAALRSAVILLAPISFTSSPRSAIRYKRKS